MHLTPLLLLAATLALTSKALPTGLNPTETSPSSTSKGMHRCCPPFKPRNKHFPPPRLPCDPNCTTATIEQHDETRDGRPAMHMIPAHEKEYKQKAPIPKHKSTEVPPTLRHHGGVVHPDHGEGQ